MLVTYWSLPTKVFALKVKTIPAVRLGSGVPVIVSTLPPYEAITKVPTACPVHDTEAPTKSVGDIPTKVAASKLTVQVGVVPADTLSVVP